MGLPTNFTDHYFQVVGNANVFSSKTMTYVPTSTPAYVAFLASGGLPWKSGSDAELRVLLSLQKPSVINNRITADRSTSSLTAVNVPDMSFPVGVSEVWAFEMSCNVGSSSAAGFKVGFGAFAGASLKAQVRGNIGTPNTFDSELMITFGSLGGRTWCANITNNGWLEVRGVVRAGSTAGVLQLQAAKVTSGVATLFTDSYLVARRL